MRSKIVNRANLNQLAKKMGFDKLIQFDQRSVSIQTKHNSMLGDAFEAIIGAIYMDKGYNFTKEFLLRRIVKPHIDIHTLLITKTNLNDQRIEILGHQDILIYLIRGSTTLNEVTIIGNSKKQDLAEIKREFQNRGVYNGGKTSFLSAIFQPLNALYNLIGKDPKNARRFGRYADNEIKQSQIDVYFNPSIIKNNTELRGDTLEKYMLDYRPEFQKAQFWNSYEYIKYIKESSKKFTDTLGKGK
jgi:hypothetical protein